MLISQGYTGQEPPDPGQRFKPLSAFSGSLANRTYCALREAILDLSLQPGETLRKSEVCHSLGISRSPVSEAVARLSAEGLLLVRPQAGTYVATFSIDDIREGAFLREAIELTAVEHVAAHITDEQLRQLRRNIRVQEALAEDGDFRGFYQCDENFHELILSMTGFPRLKQVADAAWVNVNRARQLVLPVAGRVAATIGEHQKILDALERREPVTARMAMRQHLRQLIKVLLPLETSHPEFFSAPAAGRNRAVARQS